MNAVAWITEEGDIRSRSVDPLPPRPEPVPPPDPEPPTPLPEPEPDPSEPPPVRLEALILGGSE